MIRYALLCDADDAFDAWFSSSAAFDDQAERGQIACPVCQSTAVRKAPMAPAVARSREGSSADDPRRAFARHVKSFIRDNFDYVGARFPDEARKRSEGETDDGRPIWGEASPAEAKALIDEGVAVAPLPPAFAPEPPRKLN